MYFSGSQVKWAQVWKYSGKYVISPVIICSNGATILHNKLQACWFDLCDTVFASAWVSARFINQEMCHTLNNMNVNIWLYFLDADQSKGCILFLRCRVKYISARYISRYENGYRMIFKGMDIAWRKKNKYTSWKRPCQANLLALK